MRYPGDEVKEARLGLLGYVKRGVVSRILEGELPGRRKRGRPKRRFLSVVKEEIQLVGVTEEDAEDRLRWKQLIHYGDPQRKKPKDCNDD